MGRVRALGVALLAAVVASACGGTATQTGGSASATCVQQAKKAVKDESAPVALGLPGKPIDIGALRGKSVWFIQPASTSFETPYVEAFAAAARSVGMKATVFNAQGNLNTFTQGMNQAIAQKADGIVIGSTPAASIA